VEGRPLEERVADRPAEDGEAVGDRDRGAAVAQGAGQQAGGQVVALADAGGDDEDARGGAQQAPGFCWQKAENFPLGACVPPEPEPAPPLPPLSDGAAWPPPWLGGVAAPPPPPPPPPLPEPLPDPEPLPEPLSEPPPPALVPPVPPSEEDEAPLSPPESLEPDDAPAWSELVVAVVGVLVAVLDAGLEVDGTVSAGTLAGSSFPPPPPPQAARPRPQPRATAQAMTRADRRMA
jgi:hypothetical protein